MQRWSIVLLFLLAACTSKTLKDADAVETGETLYTIDFASADAFETGDLPDASLSIVEGQYRIEQTGETTYIWGQGGDAAQNVTISVEAISESGYPHNLYGVMCRVNAEGAGYAFLISQDGFGGIARTDGENMTMLYDWREDSAINAGASNTIRGVCVDNYLALYVNDTLIGDVEDERYPAAGQVGLIAGLISEEVDQRETVIATFDDLTVKEASLR